MIINLAKAWFGDFSREELRKFLLLGVIFAFIIGVYWALRPFKDSIFMSMVGSQYIPWAKGLSLLILFPIVILYGKLVDTLPRQKLLYGMTAFYCVATLLFALLLKHPVVGLANTTQSVTRVVAWLWYVFVESYGSLMVALFWAFATDTSSPDSAKRGFSLSTMIGQIGSFSFPLLLTKNVVSLGGSASVVLICGLLMLPIILLVYYFMRTTPADQLVGYKAVETSSKKEESEPGFMEGLKLILSRPYLLGIFGVISIYEIIVTIVDFHFKNLVETSVASVDARSVYLGDYAFYVNVVAFLSLLFGISNIQRRLGLRFSLAMMPFIVGGAILLFKIYPIVSVLFWIMVGAKAINYALNGPSLKQLYVPTTREIKYKSQAWIETFGSRSSKAGGSVINAFKGPLITRYGAQAGVAMHIALSTYFSFGLLALWFVVALYLGNMYNKTVAENRVIS